MRGCSCSITDFFVGDQAVEVEGTSTVSCISLFQDMPYWLEWVQRLCQTPLLVLKEINNRKQLQYMVDNKITKMCI